MKKVKMRGFRTGPENAIRPFVAGRKNRLFYKSPAGAETVCILHSVIETTKLNGLYPLKYLHTLFERIPLCRFSG
jgi:hypothetical protein